MDQVIGSRVSQKKPEKGYQGGLFPLRSQAEIEDFVKPCSLVFLNRPSSFCRVNHQHVGAYAVALQQSLDLLRVETFSGEIRVEIFKNVQNFDASTHDYAVTVAVLAFSGRRDGVLVPMQ